MTDRLPPEQRTLRAGPISLVFEDGALRWLTLEGVELVRGVYVAIRDDRWGTVPGVLEEVRIIETPDSFDVRFVSHHRQDAIDFSWRGHVAGGTDGSIDLSMDGIAASTFQRNRIGICVLHPMELAGSPMRVTHPDGTRDGRLPDLIAPDAPFLDLTGMRWPVTSGFDAVVGLEGDLFEMEDQRNWTDASFKTFSTPLRLPYPVTIEQGTSVRQRFTLRLDRTTTARAATGTRRSGPPIAGPQDGPDVIEVHDEVGGPMPRLDTSLAPGRERLAPAELEALRDLRPAVVRTVVVLDDPDWRTALEHARSTARAVDARLGIEAVAGDDGAGLEELVADLARAPGLTDHVVVFPTSSYATTTALVERLRQLLRGGGPWPLVGGGSRANLAEFNRAGIAFPMLDAIGFPICPQVHTFDDASVIENIAAQPVAIRTAQAKSSLPLTVGPITLRPRFGAYGQSRPVLGLASEAERYDERQATPFAAAWTIGSLAAIAGTGVAAVLLHEATGPAGLIGAGDDPGALTGAPLYSAVREVMPVRDASLYRSSVPTGLAALAFRLVDRDRVLVANLRPQPRTIEVRLPRPATIVTTQAVGDEVIERADGRRPIRMTIGPYGVIRVDSRSAISTDARPGSE